jgi:hypothetical protein
MLEGKGPLYLPPYSGALPAVVVVRCACSLRYAVFTGVVVIGDGCELVRARAEADGMVFVDSRQIPFMNCGGCGLALDFMIGETVEAVM